MRYRNEVKEKEGKLCNSQVRILVSTVDKLYKKRREDIYIYLSFKDEYERNISFVVKVNNLNVNGLVIHIPSFSSLDLTRHLDDRITDVSKIGTLIGYYNN